MNPMNTITELFQTAGQTCEARTGDPLCLQGIDSVWQVHTGKVDVFLAKVLDGHPVSALRPLFRIEAGQILCGMAQASPSEGWQLVATGVPGNGLLHLERSRMQALAQQDPAAAEQVCKLHDTWLETIQASSEQALAGTQFQFEDGNWVGLDAFHTSLMAGLIAQASADDAQQQQRMERKSSNESQNIANAMQRLAAILGKDTEASQYEGDSFPLLATCRLVGKASGITFASPPLGGKLDDPKRDVLGEIVDASRVRRRSVALKGEWWNKDNGNLLAFLGDDKKPVALLQTATGYTLHDPEQGTARPVTAQVAGELEPFAFFFYRSFGSTMVNLVQMVKFGNHGNVRDILIVLSMGIVVGLLGMVTPLATGSLFDTVIPGAERSQLVQLTLALLAGVFATAMFEISRGFAMLRIEGKMDSAIQSAVWDRLLRLPATFFRDYSAGDLAVRAGGINTIRRVLSGNTLHTLFAAVFSVFNLFLLFYYSAKLALLGIALVAVAILFTGLTSYLSLSHSRKLAEVEGRISGLVFQLLGSVAKLRTTGAESRAFFNWAMLFAKQQEHTFKAAMANNLMAVFSSVYPTLASMAIFITLVYFLGQDTSLSTGNFLAFNAAFGAFMGAMLGATGVITTILAVIPIYERAKPILQTTPEITDSKAHPGLLTGDIEISHLNFSYKPDSPKILSDISLNIKAGEFVALVGSSGSGKSTLLRLLLGFETPTSGSIYYDQQDISGVDLGALRRQLGVVLQAGQLMSGDIFTNIIGSAAKLTIDDAWVAATQAGIADDIRDMPMGMHTVVSDGGGTLSGGQRQRLLIARAIVNRPRILYFDEATSALDNRAQAMVSTSLENLRATRIVIAHRLSTIVHADRILVLDAGRLVQSGTYAELINVDGLFANLAKRQIV
jgi:ATP-binding cassette subfamily C protein